MSDRDEALSELGRLALVAAQGGATVVAAASGAVSVRQKTSHRDLVTETDLAAERAVIAEVRRVRPHDAIVAEESGHHAGTSGIRWYIDPIDGTANFVRGRADHAVAVGAEIDGRMAVGAILKPATGEWAVADERGVVLGEPIVPALHPVARLDDCLISVVVGFAPDRRAITWTILGRLLPRVQDLRSTGSTCCDLLAVATGTLDVYVGLDVKPWDVAAGAALVQAAGGVVRRIPLAGDHEAFLAGGAAVIEQVAAVAVECAREVAALDS